MRNLDHVSGPSFDHVAGPLWSESPAVGSPLVRLVLAAILGGIFGFLAVVGVAWIGA